MKYSFKKLLLLLGTVLLLHSPVLVSAATNRDATCEGAQFANVEVNCTDKKLSDEGFGKIVRTIINILSVVVGAVSVIMIIIGGFRYVVSNGDSNGISGAKNTILYAVVGLIVVIFAQVIVRFVYSNITESTTASQVQAVRST